MKAKHDHVTPELGGPDLLPLPVQPAYMAAPWFAALRIEIERANVTAVAARMGVSRVNLSLFVHGKGEYRVGGRAKPNLMEARYRRAFEQIVCPHTTSVVEVDDCRVIALRPAPTHNPLQLAHWQCCQRCPYRPK